MTLKQPEIKNWGSKCRLWGSLPAQKLPQVQKEGSFMTPKAASNPKLGVICQKCAPTTPCPPLAQPLPLLTPLTLMVPLTQMTNLLSPFPMIPCLSCHRNLESKKKKRKWYENENKRKEMHENDQNNNKWIKHNKYYKKNKRINFWKWPPIKLIKQ